jgi:hypothetical protein
MHGLAPRLAPLSCWVAALLLASLLPTLLLGISIWPPHFRSDDLCLAGPAFIYILSYGVLVGVPTAIVLYRRRWHHPLTASTAGLVLGAMPAVLLNLWYLTLLGGMSATVFWATLKSCGAFVVAGSTFRPRLSIALLVCAILLAVITLSATPPCNWDE